MTYKVGDLVYFDDGMYKGVGKIVSQHMDFINHYLVRSTQIKSKHNGILLTNNNWWFSEDNLKPFTKKVGQKYKVISNDGNCFEIGDIVTLYHIDDDDGVSRYKKDSVENYMYDLDHENCWVEFYADEEEHKENEMFTKKDLKVGYLVKLRNGELVHVVNTTKLGVCLNYEGGYNTLRYYNNDLSNAALGGLDVVEVYGLTPSGYNAHKFEVGDRKLLWKREEVKEMTIEEIQKALGHKIKVVE